MLKLLSASGESAPAKRRCRRCRHRCRDSVGGARLCRRRRHRRAPASVSAVPASVSGRMSAGGDEAASSLPRPEPRPAAASVTAPRLRPLPVCCYLVPPTRLPLPRVTPLVSTSDEATRSVTPGIKPRHQGPASRPGRKPTRKGRLSLTTLSKAPIKGPGSTDQRPPPRPPPAYSSRPRAPHPRVAFASHARAASPASLLAGTTGASPLTRSHSPDSEPFP